MKRNSVGVWKICIRMGFFGPVLKIVFWDPRGAVDPHNQYYIQRNTTVLPHIYIRPDMLTSAVRYIVYYNLQTRDGNKALKTH